MRSFQMTKLLVLLGVLFVDSGVALAATCVPTTPGMLCTSYALSGVTLTADTVNGNVGYASGLLSGQFDWQYAPGDFANGSGTFTSLVVPWTYHGIGSLTLSIDSSSLNATLPGNLHSDGVDFVVALSPGLSSPTQGSGIDFAASIFDIWGGGNEYVGHVTSGSIVVAPDPVPAPAAGWLFAPGLLGLAGIARKCKTS
jgi:hypothetical protein